MIATNAQTACRGAWLALVLAALVRPPAVHAAATAEAMAPVVVVESYGRGESPERIRQGLGFLTEADGFIFTAYANLTDPATSALLDDVRVRLAGRGESTVAHAAAIIGVEPTLGLGIIKIDVGQPLPAAPFARDRAVVAGQALLAFALDEAGALVTREGTVVAMNSRECYQASMSSTMLRVQLDIPASGLGGPVLDADGYLVALYTGYRPPVLEGHVEDESETHLLPAVLAFNIYASIKTKQSLRSPWTGFSVRPLSEDERERLQARQRYRFGIGLESIWPGGPAEKLGLRTDDILVQFAHYPITSVADFQKWLYLYGVGHTVKLILIRGDEIVEVEYTIEERPASARPQ